MREIAAALLVLASGCALLGSTPALFSSGVEVARVDFEEDPLSRPPSGFEGATDWSVADSPTAASGYQVLVRRGEAASLLTVKSSRGPDVGGEVAVRVILGTPGAGIGCDAGGTGYVVKMEPDAKRVALYRKTGDSAELVASAPATVGKGKWVRLGVVCRRGVVAGYLDGAPVVRTRADLAGELSLALHADAGVTAQFDDLRYRPSTTPATSTSISSK